MGKLGNLHRCLSSRIRECRRLIAPALLILVLAFARVSIASITGSISGIITDPNGATVPSAGVQAVDVATGVQREASTDSRGFYSFPELPIGTYNLVIRKTGFKQYERQGLVINVNTALRVDAMLEVGVVTQAVTVSSTAVHVATTSTQLGEVITGTKMTTVPLNGRSYTDLLTLQPGVAPQPSGENITYTTSSTPVSGGLSGGGLSINGQRESANGFTVNGADVNEGVYEYASIIPNLDAIAEFRILTGNFNAEYGNYGGGQIMVVTKSGTNQFHGDAFEFLRNDAFDARNYYSPTRGAFKQNQFGGTIGGPIRHNSTFFFLDYQGTLNTVGQDTGNILVPSSAQRSGDFSNDSSQLTGSVNGSYWAGILSRELGYSVVSGEPYYVPGCSSTSACVFPGAIIPQAAFAAPSSHLLQYIPLPNSGPFFTTAKNSETLTDNKGGARVDANTRWGTFSGYYMLDDFSVASPYATSSLPGFASKNQGLAQLITLSDTKSFSATALNEFRVSYMRNSILQNAPISGQGLGPSFSSLGFVEGFENQGISPLAPQFQGVPSIGLNEFSFGVSTQVTRQVDNLYQIQDNFSKIIGTHTLKFGGNAHYDQSGLLWPNLTSNGVFGFSGNETGDDFADFLIGAPSYFAQGAPNAFPNRSHYLGLYAQDSWRATPGLTVNYGLRWDVSQFWYNPKGEANTLILGQQSLSFPGAPKGLVFPGDPGVPKTIAPTGYRNFAPRIGFAYSPTAKEGFAKALTGGPGMSSIRASFGIFYTAVEDLSLQVETDYPFGLYYVAPVPPLFATPYIDRATGNSEGQRFPVTFPPPPSPSNPNNDVNWAQFEPISSNPVIDPNDKLPYTEAFSLSVQRQFGSATVASLTYAGSLGRRLMATLESNPGDPGLCLSVSRQSQVLPGTPTCGPFGENGVYYPVGGGLVNGTRGPFGPRFGSNAFYTTIGSSSYNALEATLRHHSGRVEFLVGYTYSKSMDDGSGWNDQLYPLDHSRSIALSAFDTTNNFVASYSYVLPFDKLFKARRLAAGWQISGIAHLATGFPVTMNEQDDNSLLGTGGSGLGGGVDVPNYTPGNLGFHNPRSGQPYFNTSLFTPEAIGEFGNSSRRFFHGPGINNFDMALLKSFHLTESKSLEFRTEWFNIFNHAQFDSPNGNINAGTFGLVTGASAPRIGQLALKLHF